MTGTPRAFHGETSSDATNNVATGRSAPTEGSAAKPAESSVSERETSVEPANTHDEHANRPETRIDDVAPYWVERKRYLKRVRKVPELRQRFWTAVFVYLLRRLLWSFGFFPLFIAFWVQFVFASFNPVIMVNDILPDLQAFVGANPEVQANMLQTLVIAWLSIGFFFLVFDFVLTPFRSPYEYEADVYMRAWEQRHTPRGDAGPV